MDVGGAWVSLEWRTWLASLQVPLPRLVQTSVVQTAELARGCDAKRGGEGGTGTQTNMETCNSCTSSCTLYYVNRRIRYTISGEAGLM